MLADVSYAMKYADTHQAWVVVVVPVERVSEALTFLTGMVDKQPFGGRTLSLASGGRVSVVPVTAEPMDDGFDLIFSGWGGAVDLEGLDKWRKASRSVLDRQ